MKTTRFHIPAAIVLFTSMTLLAGCVTRTTVKDETRLNVHFGSPQAAQTFYDAFLAINHPSSQKNSACVYIPLPYRHFTISTDNIRFNAAIGSADRDRDGIISDSEADGYATKSKRPADKSAS